MMIKYFLFFAIIAFNPMKSQTGYGYVGFNTNNPQANLHSVGSVRLEHKTMGEGKILRVHANGNIDWAQPYVLMKITGTNNNTGVNLGTNTSYTGYTGATINLPPGKWVVKCAFPIQLSTGVLSTSEALSVSLYFSDNDTNNTLTADSEPNSATNIIGVLKGNVALSMIDGNVIINNQGTSNKTYYLWATRSDYNVSNNRTVKNVAASTWGENNFYAFPIVTN
ncbi:hypothetical protein [Chryseobacterium oryzae]|uniref:MBG domain-containing protein n=1 Tax=Chryseobacterium oryzae TaxID=2929799 RepID=A0ABY4BKS6_9FLAO|nr:hypothetical protein [Chryseobacterium oryzae]UOE39359.1 hypothetical protein MTP08_06185 [Chryseobacterium oryzae]